MSSILYQFRSGFKFFDGDAHAIGERIEALKRLNATPDRPEGFTTPDAIFQDGHDPSSPLHAHFVWDQTQAARNWNLKIAQTLMMCYEVQVVSRDSAPLVISPANVRIRESGQSRYVSSTFAMNNEDTREQVIRDVLGRIAGLNRKLQCLRDISPEVVETLNQLRALIEAELNATARKTKRAKPA